jgi:hypothetical protein
MPTPPCRSTPSTSPPTQRRRPPKHAGSSGLPAGLVLTNWQPKVADDARLPPRLRIDWPRLLRGAGFGDVGVEAQPEWHDLYARIYRVAIDLSDRRDDSGLASLQDKARRRCPRRTSRAGSS